MPQPSQKVAQTWRPPVHLLPAEILSIIFLLVVEYSFDNNRMRLMRVCRRWYAIMLSTPGIPCDLKIRNSTTMEMVRATIQGTRWLLAVNINVDDKSFGQDFNADAFNACFMATIEAASRWESLSFVSFPQCEAFQIAPPLKNLRFFHLGHGCDLGSFFEPLMTAITTTAAPRLTGMNLDTLSALFYLLQPDSLHVFCSLTILRIRLSKRMESPANILPHLQRVEEFHAQHLYLPIYPPNSPLPLIQTLRSLQLKSVSVQWMAGKVFPVLQSCDITFPHHIDTIRFQPVTMPACTYVEYASNDLDPLGYFHDLPLAELTVKSGQWNIARGNRQLIAICHMVIPHAQSLFSLDLQVRCSEKLLTCMLSCLPALEVLYLRLASPRALSETFFKAFIDTESNADIPCEMRGLPRLPLCLNLVELEVNYNRWLRGPERTALIQIFGDIVSSREEFELRLNLNAPAQDWVVYRHVESIHEATYDYISVIGISSPQGIIPLIISEENPLAEVPFKEAEYLVAVHQLSFACLSTLHHLVELRVGVEDNTLPSGPLPSLPLFYTLRVLEAENIDPSFLASQTFHRLERCRVSFFYGKDPKLSQDQVTQMPVCTRLDVYDLSLLATLKLPQIRELGVSFDHPELNMMWETHIAVNANLSGLNLLHVYGWSQQADVIQALQCLPVLKYLILANGSDLDSAFFGEFIPMGPNGTSVVRQSSDKGQKSVILCPMLRSFLIEEFDSTKQLELIPVLKEVVTLRAVGGSPLKRFTLFDFALGRKFRLVGSHGNFVVNNVALSGNSEPFRLEI